MDIVDIKDLLQKGVDEILRERSEASKLELYSREETAEILKVSLPTLNKWTKDGIIKGHRIANTIRYKHSELEKALREITQIRIQK